MPEISMTTSFRGKRWSQIGLAQVARLQQAVATTTKLLETEAVMLIETTPKTGRRYPRGRNRWHQASAPGEPPATDTGNLVNSIHTRMKSATEGWVVASAEYAEGLEFGRLKVAARPFMRPAAKRIEPVFKRLTERAIRP